MKADWVKVAVEFSRWLFISVLSIRAGELYAHQRILPQNPLDIITLINNLMNIDYTTIAIIMMTFLLFLVLIVAIKKAKARRQVREIIYVPVETLKR